MSSEQSVLVERLRAEASRTTSYGARIGNSLCDEAADEIDRLTELLGEREQSLASVENEVERLQKQVQCHCDRIAVQSELLTKRAENHAVLLGLTQ